MKAFICFLFAAFALGALAANRPSFEIEPLDWTSKSTGIFPRVSLAASGDLLAYFDNHDITLPVVAVRRRNGEGGYDLVANITENLNWQVRMANAKWIWMNLYNFVVMQNNNDDNQLSKQTYINTIGGSMLSDDTFVGYARINETSGRIRTWQYEATNNTWSAVAGAELDVDSPVYSYFDMESYRAYDNHLVFADITTLSIRIYERQANKSWKLNDTIIVPDLGSESVGVHFNGVDTVVYSVDITLSDNSQGVVYIFTKNNGTWNEQMFNTTSVGYARQGNLGLSCAFIDPNTLIVSAGTEGYNYYGQPAFKIGKVLMMTKTNGGDWTPHIDIIGDDSDVFGMSIAVNDYDLLVYDLAVTGLNPNGRFRVYTAPLCFTQPINVTCKNEQLDDCSSLGNAQLYTVNQSPSCGAVTPLLNSISVTNQTLQASFTFTRFDVETFSCNATLTCPAPVVPVASTPVAVSVPVKAPTATKVSDGSMIQFFGLAALTLYIAVF